jgi:hypothetical protein
MSELGCLFYRMILERRSSGENSKYLIVYFLISDVYIHDK